MNHIDKTIEAIFVSKVRIKALKYFLYNPKKSIHLREAVREFEEEITSVRRELSRLEEAKLLLSQVKENKKYYRLNMEHEFIDELIGIVHKSYGLGYAVISQSRKLGNIEFALLTSAFTKGQFFGPQVIDLLVVGDIDLDLLSEIVKEEEYKINREIHYMVMKSSEFVMRKRRRDQNLLDIIFQDLVLLIGKKADLIKL
ncbi:MAG: hypothetical protein NZZ41_02430 [Candidatus Dojkabacteria bacterium]|nr:hypothetical protein [Candidatus Dojkabacteria bacterium]